MAGWKTSDVNMAAEKLVFTRKPLEPPKRKGKTYFDRNEDIPNQSRGWHESPDNVQSDRTEAVSVPNTYLPPKDLADFFHQCDMRHGFDYEPEMDWDECLTLIEKSRAWEIRRIKANDVFTTTHKNK